MPGGKLPQSIFFVSHLTIFAKWDTIKLSKGVRKGFVCAVAGKSNA